MCSLLCGFGIQEWKLSFATVEAAYKQAEACGHSAIPSTSPLGQKNIKRELQDLAAELASLDNDATQLKASLESKFRTYEDADRLVTTLTEWLERTERVLEQMSEIDFFASANLETDCKVVFAVWYSRLRFCLKNCFGWLFLSFLQ